MYYFHLWVELSESTQEIDEGQLDSKVEELRRIITDSLLRVTPKDAVSYINGTPVFQCSFSRNHRSGSHDALLAILNWIAKELPGSFGIVYWLDGDDEQEALRHIYRLIIVRRGRLEHRFDPFLSPIIPVVEDEC